MFLVSEFKVGISISRFKMKLACWFSFNYLFVNRSFLSYCPCIYCRTENVPHTTKVNCVERTNHQNLSLDRAYLTNSQNSTPICGIRTCDPISRKQISCYGNNTSTVQTNRLFVIKSQVISELLRQTLNLQQSWTLCNNFQIAYPKTTIIYPANDNSQLIRQRAEIKHITSGKFLGLEVLVVTVVNYQAIITVAVWLKLAHEDLELNPG